MRFSLRTMLVFCLLFNALLLVLVGGMGIRGIDDLSSRISQLSQRQARLTTVAQAVKIEMLQHRRYEKDLFLNIGNEQKQAGYLAKLKQATVSVRANIKELEALAIEDSRFTPEQIEATKQLPSLYDTYITGVLAVADQAMSGSITPQEANSRMKPIKESIHNLETIIDQLTDASEHSLEAQVAEDRQVASHWADSIWVVAPLGVGLTIIAGIWLTIVVLRPFNMVGKFAFRLSRGDVSQRLSMGTSVNCSQAKQCGRTNCPSYGKKAHCWVEAGSFSPHPTCPHVLKGGKCQTCKLYRKAVRSEVESMGAALNVVADEMEVKARIAQSIAHGDLTSTVNIASEADVLGASLRRMTEDLSELICEVRASAQEVDGGSRIVATASQTLSNGATEQATSVAQMTAGMLRLKARAEDAASKAGDARSLNTEMLDVVERGNETIREMVQATDEIVTASESIAQIIGVVDSIAFQTNLLALNAAVEAARAGQHGKGFAVVAEEVRTLAGRSAKAAAETAELIRKSVEKARHGGETAGAVEELLSKIASRVRLASETTDQIAAIASQQESEMNEVSAGLSEVEQVTQSNAASAEETAAASEELNSQAENLTTMLQRFQLNANGKSGDSQNRQILDTSGSQKMPDALPVSF